MTALPHIKPRSSQAIASFSGVYQTYPPRLPSAPDINTRINPIAPPPNKKRSNVSVETSEPHFHNQQRSMRMKQREHYRYHNAWSKYYYGSAPEKESYRSYVRGVLKQQMDDKVTQKREFKQEKVQESLKAVEYDRRCKIEDYDKYVNNCNYLKKFRDGNKKIMEGTWVDNKHTKVYTDKVDREQLKYNPINWSCTLK